MNITGMTVAVVAFACTGGTLCADPVNILHLSGSGGETLAPAQRDGPDGNLLDLSIRGDRNGAALAFTPLTATGLIPDPVLQEGRANTGTVSITGSDNRFALSQSGSGNIAAMRVVGTFNRAIIAQHGAGNVAALHQSGHGNLAVLTQGGG